MYIDKYVYVCVCVSIDVYTHGERKERGCCKLLTPQHLKCCYVESAC